MNRTEAYIALNLLPKIGPVRVRKLLEVFGTPEAILKAKSSAILEIDGFGRDLAESIAGWEKAIDLSRELRRIDDLDLTILTQEDDEYPALLKHEHQPPIVLYVWGQLLPRDRNAIGIVGSRQATIYGLNMAKKIGFQIAYSGYTVVSGLARGIDTAAHEGALASKGRTVAVIGSGIGKLYPPENMGLAERIAQQGAVVSEFPVDYSPDRQSFPLRNRIVAGWCSGLVVVEAPTRSGSLITAQQAADMGRTIYALPGNVDRPTSAGCNRLIQQGAKLIMDGSDVLDDLMVLFPTATKAPQVEEAMPTITLSPDESTVFRALGNDELHIDEITARSGLAGHVVSPTLLRLEMKRLVRQMPGQRYMRMILT
jgi:DNA processing protein